MRRIAGVIALLTGAVLTVAGSLRPLYEQTRTDAGGTGFQSVYRLTAWGSETTTSAGDVVDDTSPILFGVPMVLAAALLVLAAVLVLLSERLPTRVEVAAKVGAVAAAALLVGSVWIAGQFVLMSVRQDNSYGGGVETKGFSGLWILVAACAVAMAGGLLVQRTTVYQVPDDDDTDTPPMGIPIHPSVSTEESSPG